MIWKVAKIKRHQTDFWKFWILFFQVWVGIFIWDVFWEMTFAIERPTDRMSKFKVFSTVSGSILSLSLSLFQWLRIFSNIPLSFPATFCHSHKIIKRIILITLMDLQNDLITWGVVHKCQVFSTRAYVLSSQNRPLYRIITLALLFSDIHLH